MKKQKTILPEEVDRIRSWLSYDPETGHLTWAFRHGVVTGWNKINAGKRAGVQRKDGYRVVHIQKKQWLEHHVIWVIVHGRLPLLQIDHRNGVRGDNRLVNLRECTNGENQQNTALRSNNTSGYKGVHSCRGRWSASIQHRNKVHHLGYFDDPREAHLAYVEAKKILHSFTPTLRTPAGRQALATSKGEER